MGTDRGVRRQAEAWHSNFILRLLARPPRRLVRP